MIESDKEKFIDLQKTASNYSNIHPLNETVHYKKGHGELLDDILDLTDILAEVYVSERRTDQDHPVALLAQVLCA